MVRGANRCAWLMRSGNVPCGKNCVGSFCAQYTYQVKKGMKYPMPCRGCGIGVQAHYRLCRTCGGNAL